MHKSSTHLSTQLSVQPHFCPIFRPPKQHEMGTFGQHFFYLKLHPFNGSFNTRLKAPVRSMRCHHCHPHTAPFSPVRPSMATCTQPLPCTHTINAPLHPAGGRCKPVVARSALFPAHCITQTKRAARLPFLAVTPSGSMPSQLSSVRNLRPSSKATISVCRLKQIKAALNHD